MSKPSYVNFRLAPDEYARLAALAQAKGYSLSELARKCLRAGMRLADDFEPKDTSAAVRAKSAAA